LQIATVHAPSRIERVSRTVSSVLTQSVEDGILAANPAFRLGRYYRYDGEPKADIRPLTRDEAALFLAAARRGYIPVDAGCGN